MQKSRKRVSKLKTHVYLQQKIFCKYIPLQPQNTSEWRQSTNNHKTCIVSTSEQGKEKKGYLTNLRTGEPPNSWQVFARNDRQSENSYWN